MKILMIAPQPFYQERGTLIAIDLLLRVLAERGDEVDLLTMHLGDSREYAGLRIFRIRPWPRPKTIKPGLTWSKIWCDLFLFVHAMRIVRKEKYDFVHAVEEAGFMAFVIEKLFRIPFVLDVDSSMSTQIVDRIQWLSPLYRLFKWLEAIPTRHAAAVIAMCESLAEDIAKVSSQKVFVLHDICLPGDPNAPAEDLKQLLSMQNELLVMYVGNLEPYQGIDLLLKSFEIAVKKIPSVRLVIIGGRSEDIEKCRAQANELKLREHVDFIGPRPVGTLIV